MFRGLASTHYSLPEHRILLPGRDELLGQNQLVRRISALWNGVKGQWLRENMIQICLMREKIAILKSYIKGSRDVCWKYADRLQRFLPNSSGVLHKSIVSHVREQESVRGLESFGCHRRNSSRERASRAHGMWVQPNDCGFHEARKEKIIGWHDYEGDDYRGRVW